MGNREEVEALATVIMQSMLASGGIDPCTHTVWTDWQPEAIAILDSPAMRGLLAEAKAVALREAQQVIAGEDTVEWAREADASYVSQSYAMRLLDDLIETTKEANDD